jgi:hypothetical protein
MLQLPRQNELQRMKRMRRTPRGSTLIEGACGLVLVIISSVLSLVFVVDSGTGMLFRTKLLMVTAQAAQYAASHQTDIDVQGETQTFVQNQMPNIGLVPYDLKVSVVQNTMNGVAGEQVTVTNKFLLFGKGFLSFVPDSIQLADTEFASYCIVSSM